MPKAPIPDEWEGLPVVNAARMRALDHDATAVHGIAASELMENAGRAVAGATAEFLRAGGGDPAKAKIVVCCGRGANGGDGLIAARVLVQGGASVVAFLCPPKGDGPQGGLGYPALVRDALVKARAAGVEVREAGPEARLTEALAAADLVLDALLGTGSSGKPAGAIHHMIQEIERCAKPVVAVDIPTGLHPDTGHHSGVFITADLTLALGLAKKGLLASHAKRQVGELKVLDVGYPPALFK